MVQRATDGRATTHGFRASFRTWAGDNEVEREVAECCLAHGPKSETEAAYNRADMIERRRVVMQRWADFLEGKTSVKVIQLRGKRS
jgi:integrase